MRSASALLVAALVSCAAVKPAAKPRPQVEVLRLGAAALISLKVYDAPRAGYHEGSGAVIGRDASGAQVALTAGHLFRGIVVPVVVACATDDGHETDCRPGILIAHDEAADLALVSLMSPPLTAREVRVAPRDPAMFETLYLFGNPDGAPRTVGTGILSSKRRASGKHKNDLWQLTGFAWPGSSGGPVLNSRGELVSVILSVVQVEDPESDEAGVMVLVPNVTFSAPWSDVRAFVRGRVR